MPLKFGKIGALIALATVAAFVLWLIFTSFFSAETVEDDAPRTGNLSLPGVTGQSGNG